MHIEKLLKRTILTRVPALFWGPPGVGKSSVIRSFCRKQGYECITIIASYREPQDFGGLPVIDQKGIRVGDRDYVVARLAPPDWAVKAATSDRPAVAFIDEITCTPPAVQAPLLRVVNELVVGEFQLPPERVAVIAAANPPEQAAGGWDLAPPLANRFAHFQFNLDRADWAERFPTYWGAPPEIKFAGEVLDAEKWARSRSLVAAYINARQLALLRVPDEASNASRAWPSPRSWDAASRFMAIAGDDADEVIEMVSGCIGPADTTEFATWLKQMDLPDPEEILKNPKGYTFPERGDHTYAVLASVAAAVANRNTPERWEKGWDVIASAADQAKTDLAVMAARVLATNQPKGAKGVPEQVAKLTPILKAAGLLGK